MKNGGFKIEKNIPVPDGYRRSNWPFDEMEVGDSFAVPKAKARVAKQAAYNRNKGIDRRYVTRSEGDGVRIWRVQ